jgi:cobalt-zinc-cadmium efflux system protein
VNSKTGNLPENPYVTVMIAGYILWQSFREIGPVNRILMLGRPPDIDTDGVLRTVRETDGVVGVHHTHFWLMTENRAALDAHVVIEGGMWDRADAIKVAVKQALRDGFGRDHATLELECARHVCADPSNFGPEYQMSG